MEKSPAHIVNISESAHCVDASIVAVQSDTRLGVLGTVHVELKGGTGNVLINTNPFLEPTTHYSVREAVAVAKNYTNLKVSNNDIIFLLTSITR